MLKHGYIKNNFDVRKWAAPEFLERAAKELARGPVGEDSAGETVQACWPTGLVSIG